MVRLLQAVRFGGPVDVGEGGELHVASSQMGTTQVPIWTNSF